MATITANTGSGNWNVNGTWVGNVQPTAADDVVIPASAVVTIPTATTVLGRSLTVQASGTLAFASTTAILNLGDGTAGAGSVALSISGTATITLTGIGTINFISTSATQQTIATGGKVLPNWTVNGVGSSYLLSDNNSATSAAVTLTAGTLNLNGKTCSWGSFASSGAVARTLTMGAAPITLTGASGWDTTTTTNLTMSSNTSVVTVSNANPTVALGAINYNGLSFTATGGGTLAINGGGTATLANLTYTGTAVKTGEIRLGPSLNLTLTGTLTLTGNSAVNRVFILPAAFFGGTAHTLTAAVVSLTNVDFMDITGAGAASPFTGTSLGNCLGNSGITFTTPATQTHTSSAGGNWSDATKWTSRVPLPQDNVVVDVNTTGTLTVDMPRLGANMTFTGFAATLALGGNTIFVFGTSIVLASGMTITGTGTTNFASRSATTLTSNGKQWPSSVRFRGYGAAAFTLADAFSVENTLFYQSDIAGSSITTANFAVTCGSFEGFMGGSGTLALGSSTVTLTSTTNGGSFPALWYSTSLLTVTGTSTIVVSTASASSRLFKAGGSTYGTLTYTVAGSTGTLVIDDSNTFSTINFSDVTNARTLTLTSGTTQTITSSFNVNGTAGKLMTVNSSSGGSAATVSKSSGIVTCDYLSVQDSTATGGAVWYAGAHSTNVSGNTGWNFQKLAAAGGGNWTTGATWVGGVAPTAADVAVLDAASGNVTINTGAVARALDCTGYTGTLTHTAGVTLALGDATAYTHGLKLVSGMTYTLGSATTSIINFISTSTTQQIITTGTKVLPSWTVNGTGSSYQLSDNNTATGATITLTKGTLDTNGKTCSWGSFDSNGTLARTLTLGASAITLTGTSTAWNTNVITNLTMSANTAVVTFTAGSPTVTLGGTFSYNGLSLTHTGGGTFIITGGTGTSTFANITYTGTAVKTGEINISYAVNITMTSTFTVTGNSAINRVYISTAFGALTSTITAATVSLANVDFMDIVAAGAAAPFTGTSLGNCLGNTNITFDTPVTQTHTASAGGNWSDVTKWTSRVPLPQDPVIVNVNTTGTLTMDMPRAGASWTFTGFTGTFALAACTVFGNVTWGSGMTTSGGGLLVRVHSRSACTLTSNGIQWPGQLSLDAYGSAAFTLADALSVVSILYCVGGTNGVSFTTGNFAVTCGVFEGYLPFTASFALGSSTITLTSTINSGDFGAMWYMTPGQATITGTPTIVISSASASSRTFMGGGYTYGTLTYTVAGSTGALVVTDSNTFGTINFSDVTNARTLTFTSGTTQTITSTFNVNGTSGKLMTINSSSGGSAATLRKTTGVVSCDYLSIQDSAATGGATWYAGANSTNVSGNTGWIFTGAPAGRGSFMFFFPA